jgi:hypothetical protein
MVILASEVLVERQSAAVAEITSREYKEQAEQIGRFIEQNSSIQSDQDFKGRAGASPGHDR